MPTRHLQAWALEDFPEVRADDNLAELIVSGLAHNQLVLQDSDVLVVASKILSKSENRWVDLTNITPSAEAQELADLTRKDPRYVEVVLQESVGISRAKPHVLVVQHKLGWVSANAGIDQSNIGPHQTEKVLLLPKDPDGSALALQVQLGETFGCAVGIIITDTHGRPFRMGNINIALGASGLPTLIDQRGQMDRDGRSLEITMTAYADQVAAMAGLLMGEAAEGCPVVLVRGLDLSGEHGNGQDLIRPAHQDLYVYSKVDA